MRKLRTIILVMTISILATIMVDKVYAVGDINMSVSPMNESIILNPGDMYRGSFMVSNPGFSEGALSYHTTIKPFYVNEDYDPVFENMGSNSQIVDWITIVCGGSGTLEPNGSQRVEYVIEVPEDAPAGGQYVAISTDVDLEPVGGGAINISEGMGINHIILAKVTGDTMIDGSIIDAGVSGFRFDGNIKAYSTVENTGNVHGVAKYMLEVYPLFSDEAVYSNRDMVETHYVLPNRKIYNESQWLDTPSMGVFKVVYVVEFEGLRSETTRMVIVCPWWLVFMVVFGVIMLIIKIVTLIRSHKERKCENL